MKPPPLILTLLSIFIISCLYVVSGVSTGNAATSTPQTAEDQVTVASNIIPHMFTAGIYTYELASKLWTGQADKQLTQDYVQIIANNILTTVTRADAPSASCSTKLIFDLIDLTALTSRLITKIEKHVQSAKGEFKGEEKNINMLTEKMLSAMRTAMHANQCPTKPSPSAEEIRSELMLTLITQCYLKNKNPKAAVTSGDHIDRESSTVSPTAEDDKSKFTTQTQQFVTSTLNTVLTDDVTTKTNDELLRDIIISGGNFIYWTIGYAANKEEQQTLTQLMANLSKKETAKDRHKKIRELIAPLSSTVQVIGGLLEFLYYPTEANKKNVVSALKFCAGDYYILLQEVKKASKSQKVVQSSTPPPLQSTDGAAKSLFKSLTKTLEVFAKPKAEL